MELTTWVAAFAATARIGPIHVAADLAGIEAFGAPQGVDAAAAAFGGDRRHWPRALRYGDLEVVVCRCREVSMITASTWRDVVELPHPGTGELLRRPGLPGYDDVVAALDAIACGWRFDPGDGEDGRCAIRTEPAGVDLTFTTDEGPLPLLQTVAHGGRQECGCPPSARIDRYTPRN